MYAERICPLCNETFQPLSARQKYCKQLKMSTCIVCGDVFETICSSDAAKTCSKKDCKRRAGAAALQRTSKVCAGCGRDFVPTSAHQAYCNLSIIKTCPVCNQEFSTICKPNVAQCCSAECTFAFAHQKSISAYQQQSRICEWCGEEFAPMTNTQKYCTRSHTNTCVVCGSVYSIDLTKQDKPVTCSNKCATAYRFRNGNPFSDPAARLKAKATMLSKYGVAHPMQSLEIRNRMYASYQTRTGYDHPSHNPSSRRGRARAASSLELYVQNALINNQIDFTSEYLPEGSAVQHSFDLYLPKYNILVDCDGVYYHGYLSDSNGAQCDEIRDQLRTAAVPQGWYYFIIVESNKMQDIQNLLTVIRSIDSNAFDYQAYMLQWCRSVDFPYPQYQVSRMLADYKQLCAKEFTEYNSHVMYGMSTIRHFHKSIYHAHVGSAKSLYEAWQDDALMQKAIQNRMLHIDSVDPSKVLAGLYISKLVPKVSVFNPVLAKYLTCKYLSAATAICDPFSGYSGRLLGVCASGKQYHGYDLNQNAVNESQEIISLHQLDACVRLADLHSLSAITCDGLLTCPPYGEKEQYGTEAIYKSCDEWISLCLQKFSCSTYVFVVDHTDMYAKYVAETLSVKSFLNNVTEYVVVINSESL